MARNHWMRRLDGRTRDIVFFSIGVLATAAVLGAFVLFYPAAQFAPSGIEGPGFPGEPMDLMLRIVDTDWQPIRDPSMEIDVNLVKEFDGAFDEQIRLRVPTRRHEPGYEVRVSARPSKYSPANFAVRPRAGAARREVVVLRDYDQVSPVFAEWEELPPHFNQLKAALSRSDDLMMKVGDSFERVGLLVDAEYDGVETDHGLRAKAGLLNVYGKLLSTEMPRPGSGGWFDHVQKILVVSRERIVALVDPELVAVVQRLYDNFSLLEYERSNADGHIVNVPPALRDSFYRHEIFSVKSNDKLGNVQLTIIPGEVDGAEAFLLDADVDENGRLLPHLYDVVVRHPRAGGTNPYYIFELLRLDYPQLDLGYKLRM